MSETDPESTELYVDKCARCETYFATTRRDDLRAKLHSHELAEHGSIDPNPSDGRAVDDR